MMLASTNITPVTSARPKNLSSTRLQLDWVSQMYSAEHKHWLKSSLCKHILYAYLQGATNTLRYEKEHEQLKCTHSTCMRLAEQNTSNRHYLSRAKKQVHLRKYNSTLFISLLTMAVKIEGWNCDVVSEKIVFLCKNNQRWLTISQTYLSN